MVIQSKKRWLVHLLIVVFVVSVISVIYQKSQATSDWKNLGPAGFSDGTVDEASIAVHEYGCDSTSEQPNLNPVNTSELLSQSASFSYSGGGTDTNNSKCIEVYVGFRDINNGNKMSVMKYDLTDKSWDYIGGRGFTPGGTYHTDLAVNSKGKPYVVFSDIANGEKLSIMEYDFKNDKWKTVGKLIDDAGTDTSLKFDHNDIPYVSYGYGGWEKIYVKKFDGVNWVSVGKIDAPNGSIETALAIDSKNNPYVAYTNVTDGEVTVKKWNELNKSWEQVGNIIKYNNFKNPIFISFKLDSKDTPYVSFTEKNPNYSNSSIVLRFDGKTWAQVGGYLSSGSPSSLVVGNDNNPYLFFSNNKSNFLGVVKKFDGTSWSNFGRSDFPTKSLSIYDNKAIVTDSVGNLYFTFEDSSKKDRITVMTTNQNVQSGKSWQNVGSAGFTSGVANFISFNIDSLNNKYVAFQDYAKGAKASVMKFDGTNWNYIDGVGGFSAGVAAFVSSAIDKSDNIYVAYQDGSLKGKLTVKKFDGLNWTNVGISGLSKGSVSNTNIKIDPTGVPYTAFLQGSKAFVMKFDGTNWVDVASASLPPSYNIALSIDSNGIPHIALKDNSKGGKLTVMELDLVKNIWKLVGPSAGFTAGAVDNIALTFSSNNIPEVSFSDSMNGKKVTSMYFDGSSWVNLGNPGFSAGRAGFISIDIDKRDQWNNVTYVSYVDYDNGKKISVMKYDPMKGWVSVGNTIGSGLYSSLKLDQKGVLFNVFQDVSKGNKATLMKFE